MTRSERTSLAGRVRSLLSLRSGFSLVWVPVSVVAVGVVAAAVALPIFGDSEASDADRPVVHTVTRGIFTHDVTEPGDLESSSNVEIRCEVKSRNSSGTMILQIIPAGTLVEPGDFLVQFDASALELERTQQQIVVNSSQALMIQSKNLYETALATKNEYLEGTYKQEEQLIESEVFVAEEDLRRAKEYLQYTRRLAAKGYVTALQVEADQFAVEKASKALDTAKTKLRVLQEFTKPRNLKQYEADVQTAKAKMEADENTYKLDLEKLAEIDGQIAKCRVVAPTAGKVIYANETDRRGDAEVVIEEGTIVRERQAVIRLPDMTKMQVKAKIDESRIGYVQPGLPATIRLDSSTDTVLHGAVRQVDEYPIPGGWFGSSVKQYATYVDIFDSDPSMRPGMTAKVTIQVAAIKDALSVPVQAVVERGSSRFVIVDNDGDRELRKIAKGPTNTQFVLVPETNLKDGEQTLREGEQVVMNPEAYLGEFELPEEPVPPPAAIPAGYAEKQGDGKAAPGGESKGRPSWAGKGGADGKGRGPGAGEGGPSGMGKRPNPAEMFKQMDANSDGKLTEDEMPERGRANFATNDTNKDGGIDQAEWMQAMARMRAAGGGGPGGPGGGGPRGGAPGGGGQGRGDR